MFQKISTDLKTVTAHCSKDRPTGKLKNVLSCPLSWFRMKSLEIKACER